MEKEKDYAKAGLEKAQAKLNKDKMIKKAQKKSDKFKNSIK